MKAKLRVGAGVVVLIFSLLSLIMTCRDLVLSLRFGGPNGGFLSAYNFSATIVDGIIAIVLFGIGWFLTREHLSRKMPRTVLTVAVVVAVLLGLNAGRIM